MTEKHRSHARQDLFLTDLEGGHAKLGGLQPGTPGGGHQGWEIPTPVIERWVAELSPAPGRSAPQRRPDPGPLARRLASARVSRALAGPRS